MRYSHDAFARSPDHGVTFGCAIHRERQLLGITCADDPLVARDAALQASTFLNNADAKSKRLADWIERGIAVVGCRECIEKVAWDDMAPPHNPSPSCESGKRPHCTCSCCY